MALKGEELEVANVILKMYESMKNGEFESLAELHAEKGYSRFSDLPPYELIGLEDALRAKQSLMMQLMDFNYELKGLDVKVFGDVAIATYEPNYGGILVYSYRFEGKNFRVRTRCTTVLIREGGKWKIIHEHSSRVPE